MQFGYGRVSTLDQKPDSQQDALLAAGISPDHLYIEKASTRLATRPKLEELRKLLRAGDTIVVTKADRIARSTLDLLQIVATFDQADVRLEILTGAFNRDDPWGKALFGIQAVFAELERDLIHMRTMEGLAAARARGHVGGRPHKLDEKQRATVGRMYTARDANGNPLHTAQEIADTVGVHRTTIFRYLRAAS